MMAVKENKMDVLLADDQTKVRSALRLLLTQMEGVQIAAEACDATSVLQAVSQKQLDLVLFDWELPGLPPEQLLRLMWYERPYLRVVAMSSRPEAEKQAISAGVHTFLSKSEPPDRDLAIIQSLLVNDSETDDAHHVS